MTTLSGVFTGESFVIKYWPLIETYNITWIDSIKSWTGLCVEESIRMTEDRYKWRKYVHDEANPRIEEG